MNMPRLTWFGIALCVIVAAAADAHPAYATSAVIGVDADAATSGRQASGIVLVSSPEIAIDIDIQNADALGAFEFQALYDPAYLLFTRWSLAPFLGSSGRDVSCQQIIAQTTVDIGCGTIGSPVPLAPSGGGVLATLYFRPRVMGTTCVLLLTTGTSDALGNAQSVSGANGCVSIVSGADDTDGDGCTDARELGALHLFGGQRDPTDPWDFFDVPVPALTAANSSGRRDGMVTISDVIAVLYYFGTADGGAANIRGVSYNTDLNHNGVPDGREYDRTGTSDASELWRSGPPNGSVSLADVVTALAQVGDRCGG